MATDAVNLSTPATFHGLEPVAHAAGLLFLDLPAARHQPLEQLFTSRQQMIGLFAGHVDGAAARRYEPVGRSGDGMSRLLNERLHPLGK